jgi:acetyl esterase/lipase
MKKGDDLPMDHKQVKSRKLTALFLTLAMLLSLLPATTAAVAAEDGYEFWDLRNTGNITTRTLTVKVDGEPLTVTHYTGYYAENHNSEDQRINIYVPGNAAANTGILLVVNNAGWQSNAFPEHTLEDWDEAVESPGMFPGAESTTSYPGNLSTAVAYDNSQQLALALERGMVVLTYGARSRGQTDEDGAYYGHSPATMTDTKAAIRFLRYNYANGVLAGRGNPDRIVVTGTSGGGALSVVIAASGNSPDYYESLYELGAAGIAKTGNTYVSASGVGDEVFATLAYCPITDLPMADDAYEWTYNAVRAQLDPSESINGARLEYTVYAGYDEGAVAAAPEWSSGYWNSGSLTMTAAGTAAGFFPVIQEDGDPVPAKYEEGVWVRDDSAAVTGPVKIITQESSGGFPGFPSGPSEVVLKTYYVFPAFENNSVMQGSQWYGESFADYINALGLRGEDDRLLETDFTASVYDEDLGAWTAGEVTGSFADAMQDLLEKGVNKAIQEWNDGTKDLSNADPVDKLNEYGWLLIDGAPAASGVPSKNSTAAVDLNEYLIYVARQSALKAVPAFGGYGMNTAQNESNLFGALPAYEYSPNAAWAWDNNVRESGTTTVGRNNTGQTWAQYIRTDQGKTLALQMKMTTPIPYLTADSSKIPYLADSGAQSSDDCDVAPYWYVRHGMQDRDTSFAVGTTLYYALLNNDGVQDVNFNFAWLKPHSGAYDNPEAFEWLDSVMTEGDFWRLDNTDNITKTDLSGTLTNGNTVTSYVGYYVTNPRGVMSNTSGAERDFRERIVIYTPSNATENSAIYVAISNSGWQDTQWSNPTTDAGNFSGINKEMLDRGHIVMAYASRSRAMSANEDGEYLGHSPAVVVDSKAAIRFVRYNIKAGLLAANPDLVVISGGSGGGGLSEALAASGNDAEFLPYLHEAGAAGVSYDSVAGTYSSDPDVGDEIYAAMAACPVIDLFWADNGIEWMYNAARVAVANGEYWDSAADAPLYGAPGATTGMGGGPSRANPENLAEWQVLASTYMAQSGEYEKYLDSYAGAGVNTDVALEYYGKWVAASLEYALTGMTNTMSSENFDMLAEVDDAAEAKVFLDGLLKTGTNGSNVNFERLPLDWYEIKNFAKGDTIAKNQVTIEFNLDKFDRYCEYFYWTGSGGKQPPTADNRHLVNSVAWLGQAGLGFSSFDGENDLLGTEVMQYADSNPVSWAMDVTNWHLWNATPANDMSSDEAKAASQAANRATAATFFVKDASGNVALRSDVKAAWDNYWAEYGDFLTKQGQLTSPNYFLSKMGEGVDYAPYWYTRSGVHDDPTAQISHGVTLALLEKNKTAGNDVREINFRFIVNAGHSGATTEEQLAWLDTILNDYHNVGYNGYAITLDPNGGTLAGGAVVQTDKDGRIPKLPTPTREGYAFLGWFQTTAGGGMGGPGGGGSTTKRVTESTPLAGTVSSIPIVAEWEKRFDKSVTFKLTGQTAEWTVSTVGGGMGPGGGSTTEYPGGNSLTGVQYVTKPTLKNGETAQVLNIHVPAAYVNADGTVNTTATVNGYTALTAPIILGCENGGWMAGTAGNATESFIEKGFIRVSVGTQGRGDSADGKSPATIVDLKAAVRFLKYEDALIPGDSNKIISNGGSGGGATSTLLGVSADMPEYYRYLYDIGAAGMTSATNSTISDKLYAVSGFCPIIGLDTADLAYAWMRHPTTQNSVKIGNYNFTGFDLALEALLYDKYIEYVNSTLFTGYTLQLGKDGRSGLFNNGLLGVLSNSLNDYLNETYATAAEKIAFVTTTSNTPGAGAEAFANFSAWGTVDANGKVTVTDLDQFITYANTPNRNKEIPGFDTKYSGGENNAYGMDGESHPHYSRLVAEAIFDNWDALYAVASSEEKTQMANWLADCCTEAELKARFGSDLSAALGIAYTANDSRVAFIRRQAEMYNALTQVKANSAGNLPDYWRIRHGTSDQHTSYSMSYSLASLLKQRGKNVNYALTWGVGHGNGEGAGYGTLEAWVEEITKTSGTGEGSRFEYGAAAATGGGGGGGSSGIAAAGGDTQAGSVTISAVSNGSVSVDKKNPVQGDVVTVTVQPNDGYKLGALTVRDSGGNALAYIENNGVYTFIYGESPVTVAAVFEPVSPASVSPAAGPFTDVNPSDWFYGVVIYAYENGLMSGTSADRFAPLEATSRAMTVTVLCRMDGAPAASGVNSFADLTQDWYKNAVQWAVNNHITSGVSESAFEPDTSVSREQLAAFLYRYAQYKGYDTTASADLSGYADAGSISPWAYDAMRWANAAGLITGDTAVTLSPGAESTRAVFAAVMARFRQNVARDMNALPTAG